MIDVRKKDYVFEVKLKNTVELTEYFKQLILAQANAVGGYNGVEELTIVS